MAAMVGGAVLLEHGIRDAVGKAAVRLMVDLDELERQVRLQPVDDEAGAAVAGIDHDLQGLELRHVDVGQAGARHTRGRVSIARRVPRRSGSANSPRSAKPRISLKAVVRADRLGLLAHELHAVVVGRIVARGDHDAAVVAAVKGREVHPLGAADADVVHIDAAVGQAAAQRIGEAGAREADVAADHHPLGRQELRHSRARPGRRRRRSAQWESGRADHRL